MTETTPADDQLAAIRKRHAVLAARTWDATPHQHGASGCRCMSCYDDPTGWQIDHPGALDCEELVADTLNDFGRKRGSCDAGPLLAYDEADALAHAAGDIGFLLDLAAATIPASAPTDRAALLAFLVTELEALRDKTDVNVAEYPRYDARQRDALDDGIRAVRRLADCQECEWGVEHTEHCPYPETHNWGCGCPTDQSAARRAACSDPIECSHEAALGEAQQDVRRLGATVDEYGRGASALAAKLKRIRDLHRETCILARGEVKPTAFTCGMCDLLDAPAAPLLPDAASGPGRADSKTQQDGCGPTPSACDAESGEPCPKHEREAAHVEGEHCFCGPECAAVSQPGKEA